MTVGPSNGVSSLDQMGLSLTGAVISGWDDDTVRRLLAEFENSPNALMTFILQQGGGASSNALIASLGQWMQSRSWVDASASSVANLATLLGLINQAVSANPGLTEQIRPLFGYVALLQPLHSLMRSGGMSTTDMASVLSELTQAPPSLQTLRNILFNASALFTNSPSTRNAMVALLNAVASTHPALNATGEINRLIQFVDVAMQLKLLETSGVLSSSDRLAILNAFSTSGVNAETLRTATTNGSSSFANSVSRLTALAGFVDFLKARGVLSASEAQTIGNALYQATLKAFVNEFGTSDEKNWIANGIPGFTDLTGTALTETVAALVAQRTDRPLPSISGAFSSLGVSALDAQGRINTLERQLTSIINLNLRNPNPLQVDAFRIYFNYFFDVDDPTKSKDSDPNNDLILNSENAYSALCLMQDLLSREGVYVPSTLVIRVLGNYARNIINTVEGNASAKNRLAAYEASTDEQGEIDMFAISLVLTNNTPNALVLGIELGRFNAVFDGIDTNSQENLSQLSSFGNGTRYHSEFWSRQVGTFSRLTNKAAVLASEQQLLQNESLQPGVSEARKSEISRRLAEIDQELKNIYQSLSELYQLLMTFINKKENASRALATAG